MRRKRGKKRQRALEQHEALAEDEITSPCVASLWSATCAATALKNISGPLKRFPRVGIFLQRRRFVIGSERKRGGRGRRATRCSCEPL